MQHLLRPSVAALFSLGLLSAFSLLHAAEPPVAVVKTLPGKPPLLKEAEAEAEQESETQPVKKMAKKPPLGAATVPEDPMDKVRERLAQKLGAGKSAEANEPGVLRIIARPVMPSAEGLTRGATSAEPKRTASKPKPAAHGEQWSYQGAGGPDQWGQLKPEYATCSNGKRQSPIDIRDGISVQLEPVQFDYKASSFRVIDNGYTVQVNVAPGNSIEVMGRRFELVQVHFHRPSEARINGRQFDMEAHLVHKDLDGRLAVVAVLLDRGIVQPVVQLVWNNLPLEKGEELPASTPIDLNRLLPTDRSYFTYMGSITTPPCSEGVLWMVMKNAVSISPEQLNIFARLYPMNARPIQSASGRLIKGSTN